METELKISRNVLATVVLLGRVSKCWECCWGKELLGGEVGQGQLKSRVGCFVGNGVYWHWGIALLFGQREQQMLQLEDSRSWCYGKSRETETPKEGAPERESAYGKYVSQMTGSLWRWFSGSEDVKASA
ncbi:uncharacterized protein ASCRUDRAFT_103752 [Ascoidea rubescens DSM 1968]|uniref:Uncharacterized protein n=1 Tax=Ascoidea rubescens DSM 1968 TaxID=1344418 RepID=A0A1D2VRJ9_9ASCO|nr:hypothetical protein ASCRUDRAFT_103752 [Ascoidea rubescens DSM 1968]ODV64242.1 hypothetical protein ASCRUDRAFT_103752 [Ascoidea rubescens DSM 1968]